MINNGYGKKSGRTHGNIVDNKLTAIYEIYVTSDEKLGVRNKDSYPNVVSHPVKIANKHAGNGTIDADRLINQYSDLKDKLSNYASELETFLNTSGNAFVFPGGSTFTFKDPVFSDHQDLVVHITRPNPT